MKKMTSQEVRTTWLNFFKSKGHIVEPGASLIPHNDPTLLWINAGVAALKKYFDGSEIPECKRITNVQKCIRTNDIDNVGKTARHHTFFEMLGNFSIGDYFRKEVIEFAVEILTSEKYFGMPKDKLYFTYHPEDLETRACWIKNGIEEDHLIPLEGNYWQIGEGPCGPNTEVFFDRGEKYDPKHIGIDLLKKDMENDRYIEIWGIVFSQFNAINGVDRKDYKELPHKNIDTGAGLERITCVLQETETNFETDLFYPYILATQKMCKKPYEGEYLMPYRVIADHIRACTFALADGEMFSNEGRGYVLRRLLRRAMRYGQKLGLYEPFLYKLVDNVVDNMKCFYPYLIDKKDFVKKMVKFEEEKFIKTLNSGEDILDSLIKGKKELSGEDAFKLYDTYGFPIELTTEICSDKNVNVDINGFNKCLEKQKELARNSRKNLESFNKQSKDLMDFKIESIYTYSSDTIEGKVIGLFKEGKKVDSISDNGEVAFDNTNFYAEMGGQVADTGFIENENCRAIVENVTKAPNKQHLHEVKILYGTINMNDKFTLSVNKDRHFSITKNHSGTHLLQAALIEVLGDGIKQKGSFVNDEYLRFDFSHFEKISESDLRKVERIVNENIAKGIPNETVVLPIEEAKKTGAIAEFDEKYGKDVRVVTFGNVSKEFCGGSHVKNTSDIGCFVIETEESIASGIRRIQGRTSLNAYELLKQREEILNEVKIDMSSSSYKEAEQKVKALNNSFNDLTIKMHNLLKEIAVSKANSLLNSFDDKHVIVSYLKNFNKELLMTTYDILKVKYTDFIICLVGDDDTKHPIILGIGKDLVSQGIKSRDILLKATKILGGSGGGRPDMSQGNVLDVTKIESVIKELEK
ncbi:MAG: alanine--tRNA ligase [Bacilli bacterium]